MIENEAAARAYVADMCEPLAMEQLGCFVTALRVENNNQNLVAQSTLENPWCRHIADSAQLLNHVPRETSNWLDLGTGAGLPGLVIAIMRPELDVCLVESRRKRVGWLKHVKRMLSVENCAIIGKRLEVVEPFHIDVISARAFASLPKLLELSKRFSTGDTRYVLPKGRSAMQELLTMPQIIQNSFHVEQSFTDPAAGIIVGNYSDIIGA